MEDRVRVDVRISVVENRRFERRRKAAAQCPTRAKYARSLLLADGLVPEEFLLNEMRELRLALAHHAPKSVTATIEELYGAAFDVVLSSRRRR